MQLLQLDDDLSYIHKQLSKSRNMIILTGAGISCSAGIPDFRSADGLYARSCGDGLKGKDLFDVMVFQRGEHVSQFCKFMSDLRTRSLNAEPTRTHRFIQRQLRSKRALRCYTQNIDGVEHRMGLQTDTQLKWKELECVQLHGDVHTLRCTHCSTVVDWTPELEGRFQRGELPECHECLNIKLIRKLSGKRTGGLVTGVLRPNVVLYGENHPLAETIATGLNNDIARSKPDMLVIIGTSLKVHGVKQLTRLAAKAVHARGGVVLLINDTTLKGWDNVIDYQVLGDCDSFFALHEAHSQGLVSPPTTPSKKRTKLIPMTPTRRKLTDITNISPAPSPKKRRTT
ncbi:NAD-dependent histone deacetylase HST3 [Cyberlindnera jadinii NRRL Y-1542]|uniref:DHS-like NAD/FAD-binding domain-containing protein n=1 Tax=Cyberlindnera jadinii (strain ATCC 18201 / CBS 1600 / BCRC 20928 / JCM 3617 / NBRC 0987 / NRRL Y-1542) TaxID=983966 RepID=A0A1E4S0Y8_CYBJN|nr:DHS-like NAD/FAD-binding domain-containing protein [Cyberlindnera jadinii NRRL Y-1542]ODV73160.1 DHS-like NAD/FAD-binding domain-containing protein [Cyberlindnera jadinii NRRL Y-1542]